LRAHGPIAVVDLETTGLPGDGPVEILEVGCVLLDPGAAEVQTFGTLVKPKRGIPRAVRALTGISDADVATAPAIDRLAPLLEGLLAGRVVVAHNAPFERHFLERFVSAGFRDRVFLDTQDLLAIAHPDAMDLRLETFARELLGREERHRALADAVDTAAVMSVAAAGARDADPRYLTARDALVTYAPGSAWLPLLDARGLSPDESDSLQYIEIPVTHEKSVPFDRDAIAAALMDSERGRRHFPGYRVREAQVEMAREFHALLSDGGRLMLEGGTGVGKSLAYLAAAIPFAIERAAGGIREPVVVSTRTKLLQDQLLQKDIPAAAAMLGYPDLQALSIKGRANYVCKRRCDTVLAEGKEPQLLAEDRLAFASLATCARLRPHGEIGTLPGALLMRFPPLRDLRRRSVAFRSEQCTREQCASERGCPFGRRRAALGKAHLVVANHDLLLRWPPDYPRFTHVIADEAHELPGVVDEAFAIDVRLDDILERVDELFGRHDGRRGPRGHLEVPREDVVIWRADLKQELSLIGRSVGQRASEFGEVQLPAFASKVFPEAAGLAKTAAERIEFVANVAEAEAKRLEEEGDEGENEAVTRAIAELRDGALALRSAFEEDEDSVASFEMLSPPYDRWRLVLRRVEPASIFHENFLSQLEGFACVSASLFVGGTADAALGGLEIERQDEVPCWSVSMESPFPYAEHMRVVALEGSGELEEQTAAVLAALARQLDGRCLGLFTSLRRMRDVRDRLYDALGSEGFDLLMPRRATDDPAGLVERFKRAGGGGVLLGARTFWQGLDIPGDALQAVDAFDRQALGTMLLNLKQMAGRLIRTEDDRGLVVIVDARPDKRYYERLSEALPPGTEVIRARIDELPGLLQEVGIGV
jgi:Rad3-related DNA helicase